MTTRESLSCPSRPLPWRCSGLVSSGPGLAAMQEGPIELLVMVLLGAMVGLLAGLMASRVARFLSMFGPRQITGRGWACLGAIVGALVFAALACAQP